MRGPKTALILGVVVVTAVSASLLRAQQGLGTGASNVADDSPATMARSARQLLRNGLDYLNNYDDYDHALDFLKAAEARATELTDAERQKLSQAIDQARRGLRGATSAARSGRTRPRSGALTRASEDDPVRKASAEVVEPAEPATLDLPVLPPTPPSIGVEQASPAKPAAEPDPVAPPILLSAEPEPAAAPPPVDPPAATPKANTPPPGPAELPDATLPEPPIVPPSATAEPSPSADRPEPAPAPVAMPELPPAEAPAPVEMPAPTVPQIRTAKSRPVAEPAAPTDPPAMYVPPIRSVGERNRAAASLKPAPVAEPPAVPAEAAPPAIAEPPVTSPDPIADAPPVIAEMPAPVAEAPAPRPQATAPTAPSPRPVAPDMPRRFAAEPSRAESSSADAETLPPLPATPPSREPDATPAALDVAAGTGAEGNSSLRPESAREVEEIARRQDEAARSNPPTNPLRSSSGSADSSPSQSKLELPRAPSPTEPRPIRAIPLPEEFVPLPKREFAPNRKYWVAAATCHMPLYFQDATLERYGQSVEQAIGPAGRFLSYPLDDPRQSNQRNQLVQPAYSAGLFLLQFAALPYNLVMDPPWEAEYDLGYYRPGDRIPHDTYYLPLTGVGPPLQGNAYGNKPKKWKRFQLFAY